MCVSFTLSPLWPLICGHYLFYAHTCYISLCIVVIFLFLTTNYPLKACFIYFIVAVSLVLCHFCEVYIFLPGTIFLLSEQFLEHLLYHKVVLVKSFVYSCLYSIWNIYMFHSFLIMFFFLWFRNIGCHFTFKYFKDAILFFVFIIFDLKAFIVFIIL